MLIRIVIVLLVAAIAAIHCIPETHHYDTLLWSAEFPECYDDLGHRPSLEHKVELVRSVQRNCTFEVVSLHEAGATFKYPELEASKPGIVSYIQNKDGGTILRESRKPLNSTTSSGLDFVYQTSQGYVH